jgi:hypothetical protein
MEKSFSEHSSSNIGEKEISDSSALNNFFNLIKSGNLERIKQEIQNFPIPATDIIDIQYNQNSLTYAALIEDDTK